MTQRLNDSTALIDYLRPYFPDLDAVPGDCVITGGPVRDALLGRKPADLDFASFDAPGDAKEFARTTRGRHVTLGTRFRTERVVLRGRLYDFSPIQGNSVEDDLARRDFTINAIGLHLDGRMVDPFDGHRDIESGTIRMIREENLADDPLRIVRAPRMTGALGFTIAEDTISACRRHLDALSTVPAERLTHELRLILEARHPRRAAEDLRSIGIDVFAFGFELDAGDIDGWELLETTLGESAGHAVDVIALLLTDRPGTRAPLLERWTWRRDEVREVTAILRVIDATAEGDQELLLTAAKEGVVASERAAAILRACEKRRKESLIETILRRDPSPFDVQPLLHGNDIATLTGATGPAIGRLKRALWEKQVSGEVRTEEDARRLVETMSR